MKNFGVLAPIVTSCSKDGSINATAIGNVCSYMLDAGCNGIFVAGSTGRGPWFSLKERAKICRIVREHTGRDIPLFAGCMSSGLDGMLEIAQAMSDSGADVAVITVPGYFAYNHNEVERMFLGFAEKSPLPVLLYDIPAFSGIKLDINTILRLLQHPNIIGLKDSSSDKDRFEELIAAFENYDDKYLFQGKEHLLADSILKGASGIVVSLLHIEPRTFTLLYKAARDGDRERALQIQNEITKVMKLIIESLERRPESSTLFHFLNNILNKRGVCENILIEHEGDCPSWLYEESMKALEICQSALDENSEIL